MALSTSVTPSERRAWNLCEAARDVLAKDDRKFYFFTDINKFSPDHPERLLDDIWITPHDFDQGKKKRLMMEY